MTFAKIQDGPSKKHRVLDAACTLFLQDAYDVSMDAVAMLAGVSKQTVYSHFDSKALLFRAVVSELVAPLQRSLRTSTASLDDLLRTVAFSYQADVTGKGVGPVGRALQSDPPKTLPEVRELLQAVSMEALAQLSDRIDSAMGKGEMRRDDPRVAAELFFALIRGLQGNTRLIDQAVTAFMHAYDPSTYLQQNHFKKPRKGFDPT